MLSCHKTDGEPQIPHRFVQGCHFPKRENWALAFQKEHAVQTEKVPAGKRCGNGRGESVGSRGPCGTLVKGVDHRNPSCSSWKGLEWCLLGTRTDALLH